MMHPVQHEFVETLARDYRAEREDHAELARLARITGRRRAGDDPAGVRRRLLTNCAVFSVAALGLSLLGVYALGPLA
jgi:hypothetical protein